MTLHCSTSDNCKYNHDTPSWTVVRISTALTVLFLFHSFFASGQNKKDSTDNFSLNIEFSSGASKFLSTFHPQPDREYFDYKSNYSFSFSGGITIQKRIHKKFSLSSGLLVSHVTGEEAYKAQDSYSDPFVYTYTYWYFDTKSLLKKMTYLQLPLLLGYEHKKINFSLGAQMGYNISSKVIANESYACYGLQKQVCESFDGPLRSSVKKTDLGLIAKFSFRLNNKWNTGIQFYYEVTKSNSSYEMTWNYYSINLLLGYKIK